MRIEIEDKLGIEKELESTLVSPFFRKELEKLTYYEKFKLWFISKRLCKGFPYVPLMLKCVNKKCYRECLLNGKLSCIKTIKNGCKKNTIQSLGLE